jgi:hypothetical protein
LGARFAGVVRGRICFIDVFDGMKPSSEYAVPRRFNGIFWLHFSDIVLFWLRKLVLARCGMTEGRTWGAFGGTPNAATGTVALPKPFNRRL